MNTLLLLLSLSLCGYTLAFPFWETDRQTGCNGGDSCCSSDNMCGDGEGDCDHDGDCLSGVCGTDNCVGEGFDSTDDCCEPSPSNSAGNPSFGYGSTSFEYSSASYAR